MYQYFIDNHATKNHQAVIFGLRELNSTEISRFCINSSINYTFPPIPNDPFNFTSDYQLRIYTSGCYYLNIDNQWKSDGLLVGPMTNHYETQCFSTHLSTFAGGFLIHAKPTTWNYVFTDIDFCVNPTV